MDHIRVVSTFVICLVHSLSKTQLQPEGINQQALTSGNMHIITFLCSVIHVMQTGQALSHFCLGGDHQQIRVWKHQDELFVLT